MSMNVEGRAVPRGTSPQRPQCLPAFRAQNATKDTAHLQVAQSCQWPGGSPSALTSCRLRDTGHAPGARLSICPEARGRPWGWGWCLFDQGGRAAVGDAT